MEFQGFLYSHTSSVCDAVALAWLEADGGNSHDAVAQILASETDEDLADEVIATWGLDDADAETLRTLTYDEEDMDEEREEEFRYLATPMGGWDANRADVVSAFSRYRAEFASEAA